MDLEFLFTTQGAFVTSSLIVLACSASLYITVKATKIAKSIFHALHHHSADHAHHAHA